MAAFSNLTHMTWLRDPATYILIAIIVLILVIRPLRRFFLALLCQLVFNPAVCGTITVLFYVSPVLDVFRTGLLNTMFTLPNVSFSPLSLPWPEIGQWLLAWAKAVIPFIVMGDAVRDIVLRHRFYKYSISIRYIDIGAVLLVKGLACLVTLGVARVAYVLIVYPIMKHIASRPIRQMMKAHKPIVMPKDYQAWKRYYYIRCENSLERRGKIVNANSIISREIGMHEGKYDRYEPHSFTEQIAHGWGKFWNTESHRDRSAMKGALSSAMDDARAARGIYMSRKTVDAIGDASLQFLKAQGSGRAPDIIARDERMKRFGAGTSINGSRNWFQYFVILGLQKYVQSGDVTDQKEMSNKGPKNHVYVAKGGKDYSTKIDGDKDSRFSGL